VIREVSATGANTGKIQLVGGSYTACATSPCGDGGNNNGGGGGGGGGTPAGSYTITVTATSGAIVQTSTLPLTVQ